MGKSFAAGAIALALIGGFLVVAAPDRAAAEPPHAGSPAAPKDADTAAWWSITGALSSDAMEGRDTGSAGHARAVRYVADRFAKAGLKPAGDKGGWTQTVPLREVRVEKKGTAFAMVREAGAPVELRFLHEINVRATDQLPAALDAPMVFRGYCGPNDVGADVRGKLVVCFAARRTGLPSAADRLRAAGEAGAVGVVNVDDPGFTIEPSRWPDAYARSISLADAPPPAYPALAVIRLNPSVFAAAIEGSGQDAAAILAAGAKSQPLKSFDTPVRLTAKFHLSRRTFSSDNVLGLLPGTDPGLSPQVVVASAHLDGYGFGEPVGGDKLYNGAFDDAAYVATIIRMAEQRAGKGFRRSVLFAAFTGEEKGLLGATWFTQHPTVLKANLAADINLDQLRPLFPLKILTMHAIDDTTLGASVRKLAGTMGIEVRPDLEPERNLNQRADHWPFLRIGVPATGFVFGFDPGTEAERRYREWYQVRYHRPQDDMSQPLDFQAAADFNRFFYALVGAVADDDLRPAFLPTSKLAPK